MLSPERELERLKYTNKKSKQTFEITKNKKSSIELSSVNETERKKYVQKKGKPRITNATKKRFTDYCYEHGYFRD